ncbi:MAG TPA: CHAD domain-containing protein [Planctomycetaceae bacterium]
MATLIEIEKISSRDGKHSDLPAYARELSAFHRAFEKELRDLIATLPLAPNMHVVDVGCGDGFYMNLFAERLSSPGSVTGLDSNAAYLALARDRLASRPMACDVDLIQGRLQQISALGRTFDMVWCAQCLFSLPEPDVALEQMARVLRPGGLVVVLENDTVHQLLLPWPSRLELTVRKAELAALCDQTAQAEKYYAGRHLPELFVAAGLEPVGMRSQSIDRQSPFDDDLTEFLTAYLARLTKRVAPKLDPATSSELLRIVDPHSDDGLLHQPFATITWLNMLAWARKKAPLTNGRSTPPVEAARNEKSGKGKSPNGKAGQGRTQSSFHLKRKESARKGMQRLLTDQIAYLLDLLEQSRSGRDCIHDIRKTFKKLRALLRLLRDDLGQAVYRRENSRIRDAARRFTAARDAQVLVTCFEDVTKSVAKKLPEGAVDQIHLRLVSQVQTASRLAMSQETLDTVSGMLRGFRSSLREWKLNTRCWTGLLPCIRRTYRAARRAFRVAAASPSVENLHEWRKQAKYLWHETEVLDRVGPRRVHRLGKQLHKLTQSLGDDHDLAALRQALNEMTAAEPAPARLIPAIHQRRSELQSQAFQLGERIFRDKPDSLIARIKKS